MTEYGEAQKMWTGSAGHPTIQCDAVQITVHIIQYTTEKPTMAHSRVLLQNVPGGTKGNCEKPQTG
jgi:hypothetical protein